MTSRILVIDDDPTQRRILKDLLLRFGFVAVSAESGEMGLEILSGPEAADIGLIVLDLVMPGMDGLEFLTGLGAYRGNRPVIVQTAQGSIETVIMAMRAGADDFVVKPVNAERLRTSIHNLLKLSTLSGEVRRLNQKAGGVLDFDALIADSPAMTRVKQLGRRGAKSNIPILIEGESGVGKEIIARAIQGESARRGRPFVAVNCGAIPENLVESILFGHEKGAFTGATSKHLGKFKEADGGTLFLDEVAELPLDIQVKLLRALQEGEIDPVGARRPVKVDFRLISATNRNMIDRVKDGKFREDLYYRLNVFPVLVPPLRERVDDIEALSGHFITRFAAEEGRKVRGLTAEALELLKAYDWPGNVRQLENTIFRAVVLCEGDQLTIADFPQIAQLADEFEVKVPTAPSVDKKIRRLPARPAMIGDGADNQSAGELVSDGVALGVPVVTEGGHVRRLQEVEADMIRLALRRYRGQMSQVARKLGIGRSTLYRKMRVLGLETSP